MDIVQKGAPVLVEIASEVTKEEFGSPALLKEIEEMEQALDKEKDGVALAAPQIGIGKRIFIVRYDRMKAPDEFDEHAEPQVGVFINPELVKISRRTEEMDEGCLSVRGTYGKTIRHTRATVRAYDEHGTPFERGAGGVLAQAFQHEIDHLNGILFVEHAIELREVVPDTHE